VPVFSYRPFEPRAIVGDHYHQLSDLQLSWMIEKQMGPEQPEKTVLNKRDLEARGIEFSNSTLLRWEADGRFPKRLHLGGTRVFWLADEVWAWLRTEAAKRGNHCYGELR
jgi:prophage regulatory protein